MAAATPTETAAPASLGERGRSGSFRTSKVAEIMAPVVEATKKGWEVTAEGSKQAFAAAKPHFDLAGKVIAEKSTEAWTATVQGTTALVARARGMSATGAAATAGAPAAAAEGEEKKPEEAAKDVDSDADDEETKGKVEAAKAVAETKKEIATESAEEAERRRKEKLAKLQADAKAGLAKAGEATTNAFVSLGATLSGWGKSIASATTETYNGARASMTGTGAAAGVAAAATGADAGMAGEAASAVTSAVSAAQSLAE